MMLSFEFFLFTFYRTTYIFNDCNSFFFYRLVNRQLEKINIILHYYKYKLLYTRKLHDL